MFGETIIVELPTCENYGKGYQQCEYCKAKNNVELLPLGHSYGKVTYTWSEDYSTCKAFRVCEHDSSHVEEEIVTATIKETSATCESKGQVIYEAVFTNYETQIKELETTALGHSYGKVTYTWSEDYSTCKAFRVCEHDSSHVEEEIVTARIEEVKPTTTLDGSKTYTAEFENPNFEIQTHVEILKKQNHQQGCLGSMVSSFGSLIVLATMALFISKKKKY